MDNEIDREAAPSGPVSPGSAPQWDASRARVSYCNVGNATATSSEVLLHFGATPQQPDRQGERRVQLLHRIALQPLAARNLHQLLSRLLAEHDGGRVEPQRKM